MKVKFSEEELIHLLYAWAAISFSFAILASKAEIGFLNFPQNFLVSVFTVGLAFLIHEISHKIVAQRYGCWAEFRKFDLGLILAVLMSFFGFVFAAPGAVFIFGLISEKENGKIAAAGPISNLILALLLFISFLIFPKFFVFPEIVFRILAQGFYVNIWLAFFNLLPFPPLDGSKIISWSPLVWGLMLLISGFIVFIM